MTSNNEDSIVTSIKLRRLTDLLNQFDDINDDTDIPIDVYQCIKQEMVKRNIQKDDLNVSRIRNILIKLNFEKYCDSAPSIFCHMIGLKNPKINDDDKNKIITVFKEIIVSYRHCCPQNRLSFLNNNYILQKICQMLGMNQYLILFNLPGGFKRNQDKILYSERIWNKLCEYNFHSWKNYSNYVLTTE